MSNFRHPIRGTKGNSFFVLGKSFRTIVIGLTLSFHGLSVAAEISTFTFYNGGEFPGAKGSLQVVAPVNGDSIQALSFDFSSGGNYVSSDIAFATPVVAGYLRFEVKAPLPIRINARVVDETGQTLQFGVDRTALPMDNMGWVTVDLAITSSTAFWGGAKDGRLNGRVKKLSLLVEKPIAGGLTGTAYFRRVELLTQAPSVASAVLPSGSIQAASFKFYNGAEFPGATGSLQVVAPTNTDSIQALAYDFTGGGSYVSAELSLSAPVEASYVRFGMKAAAQDRVGLRVTDETGQILQFTINSSMLSAVDSAGWATATVPVSVSAIHWAGANDGKLNGNIRKVSLILNKPSSGALMGTGYFRRLEFLEHAPSPAYPVLVPAPAPIYSVTFYNGAEYPGAVGSLQTTNLPDGDVLQAVTYDFSAGGRYVASMIALQSPLAANRVSFLAKIPAGVRINLRFTDQTGQIFQTRVVKPLATLSDPSWVRFAVPLNPSSTYWGGANDGTIHFPITGIGFVIDNATSAANIADGVTSIAPRGTVYFKRVVLDSEAEQLDLAPASPAVPGLRPLNTDPMQTMGVVIHNNDDQSFAIAQAMGFKRVRFDMNWMAVEKTPGVYDFSAYDNRINAMRARQLVPQAILDYNNTLYATNFLAPVNDADNLAAFGRFAREAALHYQRQGVIFELWNEPSRSSGWTVDSFATFVRETTSQIRSVDPSYQVLSGGLAYIDFPYINAMAQNAALSGVTGVGVHPYSQNTVEHQGDLTVAASKLLSANGVTVPIWTTELGASSVWYDKTNGANPAAQVRQAGIVLRQILTSWATNVPSHMLYQLRDEVASYDPLNQEHNYGLLTHTYVEKPAKKAVDLLFAAVKSRRYQGLLTGAPTTLQAMKFASVGYETVYVVWMNTLNDNAVVSVLNRCDPMLDFAGNRTTAPTACAVDQLGNPLTCTRTSNSRMLCPVSEFSGPIFVRMKSS